MKIQKKYFIIVKRKDRYNQMDEDKKTFFRSIFTRLRDPYYKKLMAEKLNFNNTNNVYLTTTMLRQRIDDNVLKRATQDSKKWTSDMELMKKTLDCLVDMETNFEITKTLMRYIRKQRSVSVEFQISECASLITNVNTELQNVKNNDRSDVLSDPINDAILRMILCVCMQQLISVRDIYDRILSRLLANLEQLTQQQLRERGIQTKPKTCLSMFGCKSTISVEKAVDKAVANVDTLPGEPGFYRYPSLSQKKLKFLVDSQSKQQHSSPTSSTPLLSSSSL